MARAPGKAGASGTNWLPPLACWLRVRRLRACLLVPPPSCRVLVCCRAACLLVLAQCRALPRTPAPPADGRLPAPCSAGPQAPIDDAQSKLARVHAERMQLEREGADVQRELAAARWRHELASEAVDATAAALESLMARVA